MFTYKKDFYKLLAVDTFVWVAASVCQPFLNAYYTQNKIMPFQIGILSAMGPIAAIAIQPIWAMLSDRTGRRRTLLQLLAILTGCAYLVFLTGNTFLTFCTASMVLMIFNSAIMPLTDAMITKRSRDRNVNFAIVRMGGTIGFAIVVLGVGHYLSSHTKNMFVLATAMYLGYAAICFMLPKDEKKSRAIPSHKETSDIHEGSALEPVRRRSLFNLSSVFRDNEIIFVLFIAFVMQFALSFNSAFMTVYVVDLGYNQSMIGILLCISAFSEVPVLFVIQRLIKKYNTLRMLCLALFITAIRILLVSTGSIPCIIISQMLQGPTYMISYFGCVTYISEHVLEGKMSQGQSILVMIQGGFATVAGSFIGGILSNTFGLGISFVIVSAFVLIAAIISVAFLKAYNDSKRRKEKSICDIPEMQGENASK